MAECYPPFAAVLRPVLDALQAQGFRPRVQDAWRSPADQKKAVENGTSNGLFGFHNATGAGGAKEALACDVLDDDVPLNSRRPYLLALALAAREHGLNTGILWRLSDAQTAAVNAALAARDLSADVRLGFDPTHVEPIGISLADVKKGARPAFGAGPAPHTPSQPHIPDQPGEFHIVRKGETLSRIAAEHGITLNQLLKLNPQFAANPNLVNVDEKVLVG